MLDLNVHDLRDWAADRHRSVDDTLTAAEQAVVGMRPDVWGARSTPSFRRMAAPPPRLLVPTPSGRLFDQRVAEELAREPWVVFACGRYEGIVPVWSTRRRPGCRSTRSPSATTSSPGGGGSPRSPEAVTRLLPGVVGNPESLVEESHSQDGLLEYAVYTKPRRGEVATSLDPAVRSSRQHRPVAPRPGSCAALSRLRPELLDRLDPAAGRPRPRGACRFGWRPAPPGG